MDDLFINKRHYADSTFSSHWFSALGYAVAWHDYPMEHSVCMEEVTALNQWLLKVLSA